MTNPSPAGVTRDALASGTLFARELSPSSVDRLLAGRTPEELLARSNSAWVRGREEQRWLGFGDALRLVGNRDSGLPAALETLAALPSRIVSETSAEARPRLFGGVRFRPGGRVRFDGWAPFGGWQFVLPRLQLSFRGHAATATVVTSAEQLVWDTPEALALAALDAVPPAAATPGAAPLDTDIEHWAGRVATAVDEIQAGRYEKVVLAVHRDVYAEQPIDPGQLLSFLAARYPDCYTFKFAAGGAAWLGASPELLAGNHEGTVRAASLAGSRPRGATVAADDVLAHDLMSSQKERIEHRLVVEALSRSLAEVCTLVDAPDEPQIMRMANIQHLYTPVRAELLPGRDILDLVAAVHPTPAVGGSPRAEAVAAIERLEGIDRGWYAAPIGWFDLEGNGEFAVALRSGLVRGHRADLFAGCGIVAGSLPAAEVAEVEQKLRALGGAIEALPA